MHGGAFALAEQARGAVEREQPQALFASDMLDVPTYLALAPAAVSRLPLVLYFHENQLTYPLPPGVERDLGYAMKHLSSAAVARCVLFNSDFHRREFLTTLEALLPSLPDERPRATVAAVAAKARVLPLGLDLARFDQYRPAAGAAPVRSLGQRRPGSAPSLEPPLGVRQGPGCLLRRTVWAAGAGCGLPRGNGRGQSGAAQPPLRGRPPPPGRPHRAVGPAARVRRLRLAAVGSGCGRLYGASRLLWGRHRGGGVLRLQAGVAPSAEPTPSCCRRRRTPMCSTTRADWCRCCSERSPRGRLGRRSGRGPGFRRTIGNVMARRYDEAIWSCWETGGRDG